MVVKYCVGIGIHNIQYTYYIGIRFSNIIDKPDFRKYYLRNGKQ